MGQPAFFISMSVSYALSMRARTTSGASAELSPISGRKRMNRASQLRTPAFGSGSSSTGRKLMWKPMSRAKRTRSGSSSRLRFDTTQLIVGMPLVPSRSLPTVVIDLTAMSQLPSISQM